MSRLSAENIKLDCNGLEKFFQMYIQTRINLHHKRKSIPQETKFHL